MFSFLHVNYTFSKNLCVYSNTNVDSHLTYNMEIGLKSCGFYSSFDFINS